MNGDAAPRPLRVSRRVGLRGRRLSLVHGPRRSRVLYQPLPGRVKRGSKPHLSTVDLRVDYRRTATPGNLLARAEVLKLGSRVSSAQTFVRAEDGTVVASGRGVYLTTD